MPKGRSLPFRAELCVKPGSAEAGSARRARSTGASEDPLARQAGPCTTSRPGFCRRRFNRDMEPAMAKNHRNRKVRPPRCGIRRGFSSRKARSLHRGFCGGWASLPISVISRHDGRIARSRRGNWHGRLARSTRPTTTDEPQIPRCIPQQRPACPREAGTARSPITPHASHPRSSRPRALRRPMPDPSPHAPHSRCPTRLGARSSTERGRRVRTFPGRHGEPRRQRWERADGWRSRPAPRMRMSACFSIDHPTMPVSPRTSRPPTPRTPAFRNAPCRTPSSPPPAHSREAFPRPFSRRIPAPHFPTTRKPDARTEV